MTYTTPRDPAPAVEKDVNPAFMFSNEGVDELIPPPLFDHKTYEITEENVHRLVGSVTEALVNIKDETGRFSYKSGSPDSSSSRQSPMDGSSIPLPGTSGNGHRR